MLSHFDPDSTAAERQSIHSIKVFELPGASRKVVTIRPLNAHDADKGKGEDDEANSYGCFHGFSLSGVRVERNPSQCAPDVLLDVSISV